MPGTCREVLLGPALCSTRILAPSHLQQEAVFLKTFGTFLSFQTLTWRLFAYKSLSPSYFLFLEDIISIKSFQGEIKDYSRQTVHVHRLYFIAPNESDCLYLRLGGTHDSVFLRGWITLYCLAIWKQMWSEGKEIKKNVVSCTVGHTWNGKGHRRIILGNGNTLSVDCPPGGHSDCDPHNHPSTPSLSRVLKMPSTFLVDFLLTTEPSPSECFPIESKWCTVCASRYGTHTWPEQGQELNLWFKYVLEIDIDMFEEHLLDYFIPTEGWQVTFYFSLFCHRKW